MTLIDIITRYQELLEDAGKDTADTYLSSLGIHSSLISAIRNCN
jgi:hypothetical protein